MAIQQGDNVNLPATTSGYFLKDDGTWAAAVPGGGSSLNLGAETDLTISSGAVTVTHSYHSIVVEGGIGSGADALTSAAGGSEGDGLILKPNTSGANDTVTVTNGTGAGTFILSNGVNFIMDHVDDRIFLLHNGTEWVEVHRSSGSGTYQDGDPILGHIAFGANYIVAANNSTQAAKDAALATGTAALDGTDDYVQMQAALDLMSAGDHIKFMPGTYVMGTTGISHDLTGTIDFRGAVFQYTGTAAAFHWGHATGLIQDAKLLGGEIYKGGSSATSIGLSLIGHMWGQFNCYINSFYTGTGIKLATDNGNSQWSENNEFNFSVKFCKIGWEISGDELTSYNHVKQFEWQPGDVDDAIGIDVTDASGVDCVVWKFDKITAWPYGAANTQSFIKGAHIVDSLIDIVIIDDTAGDVSGWTTFDTCSTDKSRGLRTRLVVNYNPNASALVFSAGTGQPPYVDLITEDGAIQSQSRPLLQALPDHGYSGDIYKGTYGATLAFGDSIYLAVADGRWEKTDADALATAGDVMLGIALEGGNDGDSRSVLLRGFIRDDTWALANKGDTVYLSGTLGALTQTAPVGGGDIVRVVGHVTETADEIFFNPSGDWVEL